MTNSRLQLEINSLPTDLRKQVEDFVLFLKSKTNTKPEPELKQREFGYFKGKIWMSPDFDEPLDDFAEYQ